MMSIAQMPLTSLTTPQPTPQYLPGTAQAVTCTPACASSSAAQPAEHSAAPAESLCCLVLAGPPAAADGQASSPAGQWHCANPSTAMKQAYNFQLLCYPHVGRSPHCQDCCQISQSHCLLHAPCLWTTTSTTTSPVGGSVVWLQALAGQFTERTDRLQAHATSAYTAEASALTRRTLDRASQTSCCWWWWCCCWRHCCCCLTHSAPALRWPCWCMRKRGCWGTCASAVARTKATAGMQKL
jgi:hypothetical protein